jgi:hypothetical protein
MSLNLIPQIVTFALALDESTMIKPSGFKGNKQDLPQKPCLVCGRPMSWRKSWAKNWDQVLYCSDRCRSGKNKAALVKKPT